MEKQCYMAMFYVFYLGGRYGKIRVCYVRHGQQLENYMKHMKRYDFAPRFIVWAGKSARGKKEIFDLKL